MSGLSLLTYSTRRFTLPSFPSTTPKTSSTYLSQYSTSISGGLMTCFRAENLAHLANAVLSQAINLIPVNITSTEMFMQRMKKCFNNKLTSKHILFTADVKSLYTSIPLKHCLEVTVSFVEKNISQIDMFNLTIKEFEMILSTLLEAGYFRFNELFFKQVKGLAMGSRPAPPLAILYVYLTVEKPLLENDFTYALKRT